MARRRHARLVAGVAVVLAAVLLVVAPMGGMANVTPPPGDDVAGTDPFRWIATSDGRDEGNELIDLASSSEHVAYATGYFVHSMSFPSVDGGPNCTALAHAPGDHDDGSPSVFVVAIQPLDGLCLGMFSPDHTSGSGESYGTAVSAGEGHVIVTGTYNGTLAFDDTHVCRSDVPAPFTLAINFDLTIKGLHCGTFPAAGSRDFGYGKGAAPLPDGSHVIGGDFHGDLKVSDDVPVIKADFNNDGTNMFFVSKVPEKDDTSAWAVVGTMCDEVENTMAANNECGTASIHDMDVEGGADSGGDIVAVGLAADKPLFFIKEYVVENGAFVNRDKGNAVKYFSALGGNPFFLMRIAPDGAVKWVKQSVESDDLTDGRWRGRPRVAVDQSGDIFVCAPAFSEVKLDAPGDTLFVGLLYKYTNVVIKYNATGSLLWALSIDAGPTDGCALTMHTEKRILVVGSADRNVTVGYAWPQSQPTPTERIPFDSDVPLGAKSVGYAAEFDTRTGKYLGHVYISSKKSNGLTLRGAASIPFDPNDAKGNVYIGGHFHGQSSFASQDVDKTGAVFLSRMQLDEETYVRNLSPPVLDDSHPFLNSMSAVVLTFTFLVFGVLFYYCYWRKRLKKRSGGWRRVANIELDDMDDIGA